MTPSPISHLPSAPPFFPARPVNGGPLNARTCGARSTGWVYEPKVNGWRALLHCPSGTLFNRHGQRLSIEREFDTVTRMARLITDPALEWLDCEAFERRHPLGRGSLVILDAPLVQGGYNERQQYIHDKLVDTGIAVSWAFEQFAPPGERLLTFAYVYETLAAQQSSGHLPDEAIDPFAAWPRLQQCNKHFGCELFEGMVAKRTADAYPLQNTDPKREFPHWVKHRWAW